jgi:glycosyltransferase involved in cell wall biosynthesis
MQQSNLPLVSFCLFTYNQEQYVKEALLGALKQTYTPLEIIISDDASQDHTMEIIRETVKTYTGPHKIVLNQNEKNLGIGAHFSKVCYELATGSLLLLNAGDDISKETHVEEAVHWMERFQDAPMIDFKGEVIDRVGKVIRQIELPFEYYRNSLQEYLELKSVSSFGAGRVVRRDFIQAFPPIHGKCPTEDSVLILRSLLKGGSFRVNKALFYYRQHETNLSGTSSLRRLSNEAIIAQYLADVLHVYTKGEIDDDLFQHLYKRIHLHYIQRKFKYQPETNRIKAYKQKLQMRMEQYLYRNGF